MTRRAAAQAVPGLQPGRRLDHPQVRRHRARAGHHAAFLPHARRRRDGRERARQGLDLHHRLPADCRRARDGRARRRPAPTGAAAARSWSSMTTAAARAARAPSSPARGYRVVAGRRRRGGAAARARAAPGRDHARHHHAGRRRLGGAARAQGRPRAVRHPGRARDHPRRPRDGLRARRGRVPHQAGRPERLAACWRASRAPPAARPTSWSSTTTPATREVLRRTLARQGWRVRRGGGRPRVPGALGRAAPAVVLLDLMMPEMDGFEMLEAMRRRGGVARRSRSSS